MNTTSMLASLACLSVLVAQDPAPPLPGVEADTTPAIVLLLSEPIELDVAAWRRQWSELVPDIREVADEKEPWLKAEADTLIGGKDGVRFVVRSTKQPRVLADWQIRHHYEDHRADLRAHRATIEVTFVGKPPVGESRHDAYLVLGSIAAALPKQKASIGIGMADHGTFDPGPGSRILAQFKDPLGAMEPESILRVFAAKASTFDESALAVAFGKEFGVEFKAGSGKPNTVDGSGRFATARIGELRVSLKWAKGYELSEERLAAYEDPRVRRLLADHKAVLEVRATGPAAEVAETARHRALARIAAAVWNDDMLGLNWRVSRAVAPASSETPKLLRREDPIGATIGGRREK